MEITAAGQSEEGTVHSSISIDIERLATCIKEEMGKLRPLSPKCCIYKVPNNLRKLNRSIYTPEVVSIGPLHHGKEGLKPMEEYKLRYLHDFLTRTKLSLEKLVEFVKDNETGIRECYAEPISFKSDQFVKMILVDAVFIIEILFKSNGNNGIENENGEDRIFDKPFLFRVIGRDMLLVENQLPFFVLQPLFKMGMDAINAECTSKIFFSHIRKFLQYLVDIELNIPEKICRDNHQVAHFIDFVRTDGATATATSESGNNYYKLEVVPQSMKVNDYAKSATELHEAGVTFEVGSSNNLFDMKFDAGVLVISPIIISEHTEFWLRNLVAFELCHYVDGQMGNFVAFMDCLINTSKDVELLVHSGIIDHYFGDNEGVVKLFNNICLEIYWDKTDNYFFKISKKVNDYCKNPRHQWYATLRRDYCGTLFRVLSVTVAAILLLLTFVQTLCSLAPFW